MPLKRPSRSARELAQLGGKASFDHLVGADEDGGRHGETLLRCGLQVNDEIEFRRLLYRQIGGFYALQNSVDIGRGAAPDVKDAGPIRDEAARIDEVAQPVDCWQAMLGGERYDALPLGCS